MPLTAPKREKPEPSSASRPMDDTSRLTPEAAQETARMLARWAVAIYLSTARRKATR
jgi:hypothetical protein